MAKAAYTVDYAEGVGEDLANLPVWELRIGEYRVFYDVDEETSTVTVRAVRYKPPHKTTEEILSVALIIGVEGMDEEQLQLGSSDKFWRLVAERRTQKTMTRAQLEHSIKRASQK